MLPLLPLAGRESSLSVLLPVLMMGLLTLPLAKTARADFSFVDLPMFNGAGAPVHRRGVTAVPGLYILGLGWLWTWGSGRFSGIAQDAAYVVRELVAHCARDGLDLRHQAAE